MKLNFDKGGGLLPAVVQEAGTGKVLMLGYMSAEAYRRTLESGNVTFFSRSQNKLWMKGEESGNIQPVHEILVDCDSDAILYMVDSDKPACHTGNRSCFHNVLK